MKKVRYILLLAMFSVATVGFVIYLLQERQQSNSGYPEIIFAEDHISVSIGATDEELCQGIIAKDQEDGNVTDSIVVEGISRFDNNMEAKITYAAFDSDNHVTRASRTLTYSDYTVPTFQLEVPLAFHNGNFDLLACITANSCLDGDLSSKIKVTVLDETTSIYEDGDHLVEFRVTDSMGKTSYLRTHVLVDSTLRSSAEDSPLQLKQTMVTLQVGASFDPAAYLVLQDGLDLTAENVNIQSTVDTAQAGDYEVTYRYANGQENAAATRLVVVVKG